MRGTIYIIKIAAKCIQVVVVKCPIPDKISYHWETIYMALEVQISKPIQTKNLQVWCKQGGDFLAHILHSLAVVFESSVPWKRQNYNLFYPFLFATFSLIFLRTFLLGATSLPHCATGSAIFDSAPETDLHLRQSVAHDCHHDILYWQSRTFCLFVCLFHLLFVHVC